jgi:hypothetical protein
MLYRRAAPDRDRSYPVGKNQRAQNRGGAAVSRFRWLRFFAPLYPGVGAFSRSTSMTMGSNQKRSVLSIEKFHRTSKHFLLAAVKTIRRLSL